MPNTSHPTKELFMMQVWVSNYIKQSYNRRLKKINKIHHAATRLGPGEHHSETEQHTRSLNGGVGRDNVDTCGRGFKGGGGKRVYSAGVGETCPKYTQPAGGGGIERFEPRSGDQTEVRRAHARAGEAPSPLPRAAEGPASQAASRPPHGCPCLPLPSPRTGNGPPGDSAAALGGGRRPTQWAQVHRAAAAPNGRASETPPASTTTATTTHPPLSSCVRGEGRPRRLPVLRSLASTFLPQTCRRRGAEGQTAARNGKRPKSGSSPRPPPRPRGRPPGFGGSSCRRKRLRAAFVTPPLAGARRWEARAAAASPFFCCCRLQ